MSKLAQIEALRIARATAQEKRTKTRETQNASQKAPRKAKSKAKDQGSL